MATLSTPDPRTGREDPVRQPEDSGGAFDPRESRRLENRGRAWLLFGFIFCPCHLPLIMAVLGTVVGTGVVGAIVRDAWTIGVVMALLYGATLWRGFVHLRRARARAAPGRLACSVDGACRP